jgi:F-type H+-transporting ATPase subunit b
MDIQIPQILFQMVNFGAVVAALTYFLYKPIQKILDERSDRIAAAQKAAETTLKDKEELVESKDKILKKARQEAAQVIETAKKKAQKQKSEMVAEGRQEAEQALAKMKASWDREKQKLASEMKQEFADTVLLVTEKVIGKLDKKTHLKLVDAEIKGILGRLSK